MPSPAAQRLSHLLSQRRRRIVFAESCTAGLVAATLAEVPGISQHLCGSLVTYREECKQEWLGVPAELLAQHSAVSAACTAAMARAALQRTGSADYSAAITGHLGPDAPPDLDGVCFLAVVDRTAAGPESVERRQIMLQASARPERQREAAEALLEFAADVVARQ
jgi:PncC family amidohydrolase